MSRLWRRERKICRLADGVWEKADPERGCPGGFPKKQLHFYRPGRIISCENRISLRGGVRFSTGGKVREPHMRLIWRNSKTDSIVWMKEEFLWQCVALPVFGAQSAGDGNAFLFPENPGTFFMRRRVQANMPLIWRGLAAVEDKFSTRLPHSGYVSCNKRMGNRTGFFRIPQRIL